jgi:hypothetical protein
MRIGLQKKQGDMRSGGQRAGEGIWVVADAAGPSLSASRTMAKFDRNSHSVIADKQMRETLLAFV